MIQYIHNGTDHYIAYGRVDRVTVSPVGIGDIGFQVVVSIPSGDFTVAENLEQETADKLAHALATNVTRGTLQMFSVPGFLKTMEMKQGD